MPTKAYFHGAADLKKWEWRRQAFRLRVFLLKL